MHIIIDDLESSEITTKQLRALRKIYETLKGNLVGSVYQTPFRKIDLYTYLTRNKKRMVKG